MSRPTERYHRCTDLSLLLPIREEGYRSLQATANVIGVPYTVLRRLVHGQRTTAGEEAQIRQAWMTYSPDAVIDLMDVVFGGIVRGDTVHPAYAKQLWTLTRRLLEEVTR